MTYIFKSEITARNGKEDRLRSTLADFAASVRKEPGNDAIEVYAKSGSERSWLIIEHYADKPAFDLHCSMSHTKAFQASLSDLAEESQADMCELARAFSAESAAHIIRGIDHVGVTVPDIDEATRFFEQAFGARTLYDVLPETADPMEGEDPEKQLGLSKGARIEHMRLLRIGQSANIEMFRIENAHQAEAVSLQDYGLQHIAIYVDDMDQACRRFQNAGGNLLSDPHPLANAEASENNSGVYGRAPWGMLIELIHMPDGVDYPADCPMPRWRPLPNQ